MAGAKQVFHLHLVSAGNDIRVQNGWVQAHFSIAVQVALEAMLGELPRAERSVSARAPTKKRNRCGLCVRSNDTKYNVTCTSCLSFICPEHTMSKTVTINCTECAAAGDND